MEYNKPTSKEILSIVLENKTDDLRGRKRYAACRRGLFQKFPIHATDFDCRSTQRNIESVRKVIEISQKSWTVEFVSLLTKNDFTSTKNKSTCIQLVSYHDREGILYFCYFRNEKYRDRSPILLFRSLWHHEVNQIRNHTTWLWRKETNGNSPMKRQLSIFQWGTKFGTKIKNKRMIRQKSRSIVAEYY